MNTLLKYYCNPMILTMAAIGYFSPFFLPLPPGGSLRLLLGTAIALLILLFVVSACIAWLVAVAQTVLGVISYRNRSRSWRHHIASAIWTYACYGIVIVLLSSGYYMTA